MTNITTEVSVVGPVAFWAIGAVVALLATYLANKRISERHVEYVTTTESARRTRAELPAWIGIVVGLIALGAMWSHGIRPWQEVGQVVGAVREGAKEVVTPTPTRRPALEVLSLSEIRELLDKSAGMSRQPEVPQTEEESDRERAMLLQAIRHCQAINGSKSEYIND